MQPAKPHDDNSTLDGLVAQYLEALERGEQPDRKQFLQQHPDIATELSAFFADFDKVEATKLQAQLAPDGLKKVSGTLETSEPQMQTVMPESSRHLFQPKPGAIISGRYKLLENIGEGGMGSVWVAEQQQPVKRRVAIKLVKAGMDSKQVLARFEAERQALAVMDHPNIAKVFDGGMTEQGRPYFVMEYVKGVPFTEYCDKARLSLKERLNLFIPVCQAVQHAHHKGIVHRDLKPSNILICLYDGKPVPKVIDFGLAKAMHQSLTDQSIYTGHGIMVGTPLYMSPEQAEHNNLDVDTRTDIYSLGVVLYELLVGTTPLERRQLQKAAFEEVLRLIQEVEPPRPSLRLSTSASLPSIAAQRSIDPKQLSRSVAGDLDWIVMKSLEKERSRRYETAIGLARDIERFLNDEAVEACPPSRTYRLKKFLRKHRGQVIAAGAVLLALIVGIAGTTLGMYQAIRAERASKLANQKLEKHSEVLQKAMEELYAESNLASPHEMSKSSGVFFDGKFGIDVEFKDHKIVKTSSWMSPDADPDIVRAKMAEELRSSVIFFIRENQKNLSESVKNLETANATLARSLTHSIGYGTDPAPPELKSLADWSALTDSNLKLRTLEVALEEPETALRIARRAERVILACVGLSPTRREKALELLSAKQRDMTIEPRIRLAACWLAVALASEELPALEESISCLSAPNADDHRARQEFREFVDFIASRSTSLSPDQLTRFWDAFTAVVETDGSQLDTVSCGLVALAPGLASDQATLGAESIITLLEKASKHPASLALNGMVINLDGRRVEIASDHSTLAESGKVLDALHWRHSHPGSPRPR